MNNEATVPAPRLVIINPIERAGLVLSLSEPQLVIGQSASADLVIDDPYISGRHALITTDGSGQVTIRDLNSTSGTFVNGERLAGGTGARNQVTRCSSPTSSRGSRPGTQRHWPPRGTCPRIQ